MCLEHYPQRQSASSKSDLEITNPENTTVEIIKLKPKHGNPNETVFVFRLVDGLYDSIEDWMNQKENEEYSCEEDK